MLIRTQDKNELVNAILISIKESKKKSTIHAKYAGNHGFADNDVELGEYNSKEMALKELDDLTRFLTDNPSGIYQMK